MDRTGTRRTVRTARRTRRPALSPYSMEDVAFMLADIVRHRAAGTSPVEH